VIVVPRYAMRDERHILVVDAEDRLRTREVEVLRIDGDDVLIQGALAPGERICVSPVQVVVEGMRVQPLVDDEPPVDRSRS
jgi:multidrug efflux pump subunit AcrA (membrane-fusion protein)